MGEDRFLAFSATRGQKWFKDIKDKKSFHKSGYFVFYVQGHFRPLEAETAKKLILAHFWKFQKTGFLYYSYKGEPNDLKFGTNVLGHIPHKIH